MVNKTLLPNGIRIVSKQMPHVHSVSMGVWVDVGARDESDEQGGLSHFIEHMIFKGTARRSAYQIARAFDAIGGHTNAFTSMENTCYYARVMDTHLDTMADILSDIFLNSVFDPDEVERERAVIFQEIGMMEDTPEDFVHVLAGFNFWGNHPLGRSILGTREHILSFSAEAIQSYFRRFYHPERIIISAVGNVSHQHILDLVGPAFADIHTGQALSERTTPPTYAGVKMHPRALEQAHICLASPGLSITDPRRFAFSLMNTILGGNMSSRLFQEIREQRGLAYSVYSFMNSHVDSGMFGVYTGVHPDNVRQCIELILQGIQRLRITPVTAEELKEAMEYTRGNLFLASESVENQMVRLAQNEIHFNRYISLQSVIDKVEAVTVEQIIDLANTLFEPGQLSLTVLGPGDETIELDDLIADTFK